MNQKDEGTEETEEEMEGPTSAWGSMNRKHAWSFMNTMMMNFRTRLTVNSSGILVLLHNIYDSSGVSDTVEQQIQWFPKGCRQCSAVWPTRHSGCLLRWEFTNVCG